MMKMEKETIRKLISSRRNMLSPQEIREKSATIAKKLFELPEFMNAQTVFSYISFSSEVRTEKIIIKCIELGKKVVVPAVDTQSNEIIAGEFNGFDKLKKSTLGVMEPAIAKEFPVEHIGAVLVPGIAFDQEHNRIGFGKGFFDRFLAKLPKTTPTIALAFELQIVPKIPAERFDERVQKIITEKRVF